jgi:LysR family glycine cleavage system transcriptional activator
VHLPPFKGILAFDVVARLGSLAKAAEEVHLTPSAVSHQIAGLESFVGQRLFDRTSRGLTLTVAGERFHRDITSALAQIASAAQNVRGDHGEVLRLHLTPTFASLWLLPRLPRFRALHPDIRVQLSAAHTESDFSRGDVDLDVRYGIVRGRDLHVETLFTENILPLIAPSLKSRLDIRTPEDLVCQDLIFSSVHLVQWPRWFAAHGIPLAPDTYALSFDRTHMVLDAATQGLGIALESDRMAQKAMQRGELVPVFADRKGVPVHAHHLVYPRSHGQWSRVARFTEWLRAEIAGEGSSQSS